MLNSYSNKIYKEERNLDPGINVGKIKKYCYDFLIVAFLHHTQYEKSILYLQYI